MSGGLRGNIRASEGAARPLRSWYQWGGLVAILVWAAVLRFGWVGVNSFAFDEARLSLIALEMGRGGTFAALGMPSSAGVANPPAAAWLFALPYAVSTDPLVATWFVGVLNLLAIFALWDAARRTWGVSAAHVAALYLAASPFAVLYARSVWAQNLLIPLAVAWLWTAQQTATGRRRGLWIGLHVFVAGLAFQVHLAGAALIVPSVYLVVRRGWWRRPLALLAGAGAAGLAFAPYVWRVLSDDLLLTQMRGALGGAAAIDVTALSQAMRLMAGWDWGFLAAGALSSANDNSLYAGVLVLVIVVCIVLLATRGAVRRSGDPALNASAALAESGLLLLIGAVALFTRHTTPVFVHYLLPTLPACALALGLAAAPLRTARKTAAGRAAGWRILIGVGVVVQALVWSWQLGASLETAGQVETPNGMSTPLGLLRAAAYSAPPDLPALLLTHGDDPAVDGEAAVFAVLWWGRPHRIVDGTSVLIVPDAPAYVMATLAPFQAWEEVRLIAPQLAVRELPRRLGAQPFVATVISAGDVQAETADDFGAGLTDGTTPQAARVRRVGDRLRVTTVWEVSGQPPAATVQQFHHLYALDEDGVSASETPMLTADVPIHADDWQRGDRLYVMGDFFEVAAGAYRVEFGHYTLPALARFPRSRWESASGTAPDRYAYDFVWEPGRTTQQSR